MCKFCQDVLPYADNLVQLDQHADEEECIYMDCQGYMQIKAVCAEWSFSTHVTPRFNFCPYCGRKF